ncbi:MAG: SUMF1/EgtB/PvdO family nonheme iron enzyme [Bacteroidales bacterium]|nr:SUMF1/EgtB/PvdO family nonheme iron enzyme [Bacteroidales bacterium]
MKETIFFNRVVKNPYVQTVVIYVSGGWIILEIIEYFIENFGLNEFIRNIILIILLSILPVALFLVWYFNRKQGIQEKTGAEDIGKKSINIPERGFRRILYSFSKPKILVPFLLIIIAGLITIFSRLHHQSVIEKALTIELPLLADEYSRVYENVGIGNWDLFNNALELRKILKNNPEFIQTWNEITDPFAIITQPGGAMVYGKPYSKPDTSWYLLGKTPLWDKPFPKGLTRIKIEKPDYQTQYDLVTNFFHSQFEGDTLKYRLYKENELPGEMVYVPGFNGNYWQTPYLPQQDAGEFWIDRYEVTNSQYKTFMDSEGYSNPEYWQAPFVEGDDSLYFQEAVERFKDQTGWYGPAFWELGEFPKGEDELPVSGISWYEAAAYARFVEKELPSIYHWRKLSVPLFAPEIVCFGNFDNKGLAKVGTYNSLTRYGTYDLPGNVSEWIFNSSGNDRFIIGGNYKEPTYWYTMKLTVSPWTRNELVGFRCMRYIDDSLKKQLTTNINQPRRDYSNLEPVSDEIFQVYKELFYYKKTEQNPVRISKDQTENWIHDIISVEVPYEDLPMQIHIYLPLNSNPPFQSILFFPGLGAHNSNTIKDMSIGSNLNFWLKNGRAVIWPVYYSTFGRGSHNKSNVNSWKQTYRNIITDVHVVCDYLETRNDIDSEKIAFSGFSWGGGIAPYILATEERIKLGIVALFGVQSIDKYMFKEFDQIDYLPRVKIPMLLLGGKFDFDYTMEQQKAFYDLLGTPEGDKKWIVYESTHYIPRKDLINESVSWLDNYFGPVN